MRKQTNKTKKQTTKITLKNEPITKVIPDEEEMSDKDILRMISDLESYPNPKDPENLECIYMAYKAYLINWTEKKKICFFLQASILLNKYGPRRETILQNLFKIIFGAYEIPISNFGLILLLCCTAVKDKSPLDHVADDLGLFHGFSDMEFALLYEVRPYLKEVML